jgi:toxin CcdB
MRQFEGFINPIAAARPVYPYVLVLQSDWASDFQERIVAPVVPRAQIRPTPLKVTPLITIDRSEYLVLVPALSGVRTRDLRVSIGSFASDRQALLAAIDYLFFGH